MDQATTCVTCAAPLAGDYCARCGEKRPDLRDLRLRTFLRHSAESFFNLDATAWRTFGALVARPGRLTAEFAAGRRRPWLSPIQVFLIVNVAYFFLATPVGLGGTLNTSLRSQLEGQRYSETVRDMVRARFVAAGTETVDFAAFESRYNFATDQYAKSLVLVLVPMFAALLGVLFAGRGVPFVVHLVFGLHFIAYLLVMLLAVGATVHAVALVMPGLADWIGSEAGVAVVMFALLAPWLTLALRRAYGSGVVAAALRAVVLFGAIPIVLMAYRCLLFLVVIRSI